MDLFHYGILLERLGTQVTCVLLYNWGSTVLLYLLIGLVLVFMHEDNFLDQNQ